LCPLRSDCVSFKKGNPLSIPHLGAAPKKAQEHEIHLLRVYVMKGEKLLVYQKEDGEWLSGQFEVPTFILKTTDKKLQQYPVMDFKGEFKASFKTGITKYKIENKILHLDEKSFKKMKFERKVFWKEVSSEESNFTTATLKGLKYFA
jgi:A/G-specific adenine glycosylase